GVDLGLLRTNLLRRKAFWTAYGIVLFFQLIVNGVLTGLPVVRYDRDTIVGWRVVNAPIEDLLFGFAMVLLTLATWVWLSARAAGGHGPDQPAGGHAGRAGDRNGQPPAEHVVAGRLDLVQDPAVQHERGAQAVARGRMHQLDAGRGVPVQVAGPGDLGGQQVA